MAIGSMPKDARSPEQRRAALDPSLADMLDTLSILVAYGGMDDQPQLRATTLVQLWEWGFDIDEHREGQDDEDVYGAAGQ